MTVVLSWNLSYYLDLKKMCESKLHNWNGESVYNAYKVLFEHLSTPSVLIFLSIAITFELWI